MEIATVNASSLPVKLIVECCWGYLSSIFAYFKPFAGLKYTTDPDWSKKFFKPMKICPLTFFCFD